MVLVGGWSNKLVILKLQSLIMGTRIIIACLACLFVAVEWNTWSYRSRKPQNYLQCSTHIDMDMRHSCRLNRMGTAWWARNQRLIVPWISMQTILEVRLWYRFEVSQMKMAELTHLL
jgi:hypothetical protein